MATRSRQATLAAQAGGATAAPASAPQTVLAPRVVIGRTTISTGVHKGISVTV